jgi:hypothetical protein
LIAGSRVVYIVTLTDVSAFMCSSAGGNPSAAAASGPVEPRVSPERAAAYFRDSILKDKFVEFSKDRAGL